MRSVIGFAAATLLVVAGVACGGTDSPGEPGGSSGEAAPSTSSSGGMGGSSGAGSSSGGSSSGARPDPGPDAGVPEEGGTAPTEAEALCNQIQATSWTPAEADSLLQGVVAAFATLKRDNDALIDERGVGGFVGSNTDTYKALVAGNKAGAVALIQDHVADGYDAEAIVDELVGTSCIGRVYRVLDQVYTALGRGAEWDRIEACGRAWNSDGLHVQDALIRSGWGSPALPLVSDAVNLPGSAEEVALSQAFLQAAAAGSYYGVPLSTTKRLQNFLPSPGSSTPRDTSVYDQLSSGTYLAFATLRAAYHVPVVVPGRFVPADLAPPGDGAWTAARAASEPFVLESHSYREAWDKTNFELRPLTRVIGETFTQTAVYATGTLLFAPHGSFVP